jgi:hypothetical protein
MTTLPSSRQEVTVVNAAVGQAVCGRRHGGPPAPAVTRASPQADLLAAHGRAVRLNIRTQHLEKRLSEILGEQVRLESGLGAPADIDILNQKIAHLEQQVIDLRLQTEQRDEDLIAAPAANREFMARLNDPSPH